MKNNIKRFLPKMYMVLAASFAVIALNMLFDSGAAFGQATPEPQTTTTTKLNSGFQPAVTYRVIETHTVQYIEKPVTVIEYVDRVERVPMELRNYNGIEELKQWLVEVKSSTTTIYFERPGDTVDCDDFALTLQRKALADRYVMSFQIIETNRYNSLFEGGKMPPNTLHAINLVVVGNNAYYIEPQTGEIVLAAQLD